MPMLRGQSTHGPCSDFPSHLFTSRAVRIAIHYLTVGIPASS
jgi:hypothetical protein